MWSEEEKKRLGEKLWGLINDRGPDSVWEQAVIVADLAVELAAARGGTMTAAALDAALEWVSRPGNGREADQIRQHISAMGARNAVLEARLPAGMKDCTILLKRCEVGHHQLTAMNWVAHGCSTCELDALRAELARLKPSGQVAEDIATLHSVVDLHRSDDVGQRTEGFAALSRLAAGAQEAEALRARVKELEAERDVARGLAATNQEHLSACVAERDAARAEVDRLKGAAARASAEPRHTYRPETRDWNLVARAIRILEEATTPTMTECYPCSPTCTHDDAAKPGHPERVRERSEAMRKAALRDYAKQKDDWRPADADAYDAGSEAMRAACWEAAQEWMRLEGGAPGDAQWDGLKAAIEGAAP